MTNFERYRQNLTEAQFVESMVLNCDGCPAYPCAVADDDIATGIECYEELLAWCEAEEDRGEQRESN